jgi:hypothetical protein
MNKLIIKHNDTETVFNNVQDYDIEPMIVENGFGVMEEVEVIVDHDEEFGAIAYSSQKKLKLNDGVTYEVVSLKPEIEDKEKKKKKVKDDLKLIDIDKITTVKDLKQVVKMLIERIEE